VARFYAPSDLCGAGGMYRERIHSTPIWRGAAPRYDTVFVETDPELPGMRGMMVGRVFLFFSFTFRDAHYPCALIHWYPTVGTEPDKDTGLWVVKPKYKTNGHQNLAIVRGLYPAPQIPYGIRSFLRIPPESAGIKFGRDFSQI